MKRANIKKERKKAGKEKQTITGKMRISELMRYPKAVEVLMQKGMMCLGCPGAMQETLEQGIKAHGLTDKDVQKIIDELNKAAKKE